MPNTGEFEPIETQEEFDRRIKDRINRERRKIREEFSDYDEMKQKLADYEEQDKATKAELQSLKQEAAKRKQADDLKDLRGKVADSTGLPLDMVAALSGTDEETLTKQAEAMAKWAKPKSSPKVPKPGSFDDRGGSDDAATAAKRQLASQIFGTKTDE